MYYIILITLAEDLFILRVLSLPRAAVVVANPAKVRYGHWGMEWWRVAAVAPLPSMFCVITLNTVIVQLK